MNLYSFSLFIVFLQSKYKKPVSHEQTSDSEVPQKIKKRRTQSYTATSSYRSRRKAKTPLSSASNTSTRVADKSDSSSDYDDDYDGFGDARNGNLPSTSSAPVLDINIPSTSTGITANGKGYMFRIANAANDSDDDQSIPDTSHPPENMLRVLRSPPIHNNNHAHYQNYDNVNEGAGTSSTQRSNFFNSSLRHQHEIPPNGRRKPHEPHEDDSSFVEDYASTNSNSLMSSTEESSNDSYPDYYGKKRKLDNGNGAEEEENGNESSNNNSSSFNNNNSFNTVNNNYANGASSTSYGISGTPTNRLNFTPDSGNSTLPTPSPSSSKGVTNNGNQSDFLKKIENIKRNYRKNIQTSDDDSD